MIRNITFMEDDLIFIEQLDPNRHAFTELIYILKALAAGIQPGDTLSVELGDALIAQLPKAEDAWEQEDSGIVNHMAIQFFHDPG